MSITEYLFSAEVSQFLKRESSLDKIITDFVPLPHGSEQGGRLADGKPRSLWFRAPERYGLAD